MDPVAETVRDQRSLHWFETGWRGLRFALRGLRNAPGFTVVSVSIIAIGVGASTAVFSLVDAVLLESLPVPNPHELRLLRWSATEAKMRSYNGDYSQAAGDRHVRESVSHPTFMAMRDRAAGMAEIFGYFPAEDIAVVMPHSSVSANGLMVSDNFFAALGVRAHIGRVIAPGDDASAVPNVVITHGFWQSRFGGDAAALGATLQMLGTNHTIIGILPPDFPGIHPGTTYDFYVPMYEGSPFLYVPLSEDWHWFIRMMGRMKDGTSDAQIEAALTPIFARAAPDRVADGRIELAEGRSGLSFHRDLYGRPLALMLGTTAMVMLIACANLGGLSLSRGAAREHEFAVRAALGASRRRLIGQSLAESAILAVLGGGLGIVFATWTRHALSTLLAGSPQGLDYDLGLDGRVLGFSLAAATITALLAGLFPALRAGGVDPLDGLKPRGATGAPRLRLGRVLVVAQICVSLSILVGAGLGWKSLLNLRHIETGFDNGQLVVFSLNPSSAGYDNRGLVDFHQRAQAAVAALPGVESATVMHYTHLDDRRSTGGFRLADDDLPPGERRWTRRQAASETFFDTMGIPIIEGRSIFASDTTEARKVVVVNETFAREVSPGRSPIGRSFEMWDANWTIVGVCRDAKLANLKEEVPPTAYFAFAQRFYDRYSLENVSYAVRTTLPATALRQPIEQAIKALNPDVPVSDYAAQDTLLNRNIGHERMLAMLSAALAGVALVLCCIGLYGLIAYDVTRRRGEIAIRLAIGAQPGDVVRPILRQALVLAALGIATGVPLVLGLTRLIQNQLHGVPPHDPATLVSVAAVLLVVAALAALLPAWRAMRVAPLQALRNE